MPCLPQPKMTSGKGKGWNLWVPKVGDYSILRCAFLATPKEKEVADLKKEFVINGPFVPKTRYFHSMPEVVCATLSFL